MKTGNIQTETKNTLGRDKDQQEDKNTNYSNPRTTWTCNITWKSKSTHETDSIKYERQIKSLRDKKKQGNTKRIKYATHTRSTWTKNTTNLTYDERRSPYAT